MQTPTNSVTYNRQSIKCGTEHRERTGHFKVPGEKVWHSRTLALGVVGKMPISVLKLRKVRNGDLREPEIQLFCELGFFKVLWRKLASVPGNSEET